MLMKDTRYQVGIDLIATEEAKDRVTMKRYIRWRCYNFARIMESTAPTEALASLYHALNGTTGPLSIPAEKCRWSER